MDIKNILVPIDFSQPSQLALRFAVDIARRLRANLTLVHVLEPLAVYEGAPAANAAVVEPEDRETLSQELEALVSPEDQDDLNLKVLIKAGNARKEISDAVEEMNADFVVMGTHGRKGLGRMILGSTTEALLRRLPVPVLTVSHASSPRPIKRILLAANLSDASHAAFASALDIAQTLGAEIVLLHAFGDSVPALRTLELPQEVENIKAQVRRQLDNLAAEGKRRGVETQTILADGFAAPEILKASGEYDADLILMGIEKKGFVERVLFGTTAEHVIRESHVPVLAIPVTVAADHNAAPQAV